MSFDLTPGDDQRQILDAAQSMLDSHYPLSRLRDAGHNDNLAPLAEFGTFLLALPEDAGGAGFSLVEEARLHAQLGRHMVGPAAVATSVAVRIALAQGDETLAGALSSGEAAVSAGVARQTDILILGGKGAEQCLIRTAEGAELARLDAADTAPATSLGHSSPMSRATLDLVGRGNSQADAAALRLLALLTSAQLLGVATQARDLAVDYAKTREQFGQPIGSFQAIKHHCANMAIGVEMLSAQLDMAAIALRDGREDAGFQIAALARLAPRIAMENARTGIQIHGGIGFSAEADAHLCVKQSHILRQYLGVTDLMSEDAPMAPLREATL